MVLVKVNSEKHHISSSSSTAAVFKFRFCAGVSDIFGGCIIFMGMYVLTSRLGYSKLFPVFKALGYSFLFGCLYLTYGR